MKFSYGKGSDSFVQRQMRLEKLPKCGFEWVSTRGINANDEVHPKHKCKVVHSRRHAVGHRCNCGAQVGRRQ